jgi:hypothetical protein
MTNNLNFTLENDLKESSNVPYFLDEETVIQVTQITNPDDPAGLKCFPDFYCMPLIQECMLLSL